jgi:hypothetical protein
MKLNIVTKICLLSAVLLVGGVLFAQGAGFVSYEDNSNMIFWDNVRLVGYGLNMSSNWTIAAGNINIGGAKDLYIRKFIGLNCPKNYPSSINCTVTLGDIGGNTFVKIEELNSQTSLTLKSTNSGVTLAGNPVYMGSPAKSTKLILLGDKNLIATEKTVAEGGQSVFTDNLKVNELSDSNQSTGLTIHNLLMDPKSIFITHRIILYDPPIK